MTLKGSVSYIAAEESLIVDPTTLTKAEWATDVVEMGPYTGPYAQNRVHFAGLWNVTNKLYTVLAYSWSLSVPPSWLPGAYGFFLQDYVGADKRAYHLDWTWLPGTVAYPNDAFHYGGVNLLCDPDESPRQAHRFVAIDNVDIQGTVSGAGGTGASTSLASVQPITANKYTNNNVIIRPGLPSEEVRTTIAHPANELRWTLPLTTPVSPGDVYEIRQTGTQIRTRDALTWPDTIRFRQQKIGSIAEATGELWRNIWTGAWLSPLPGGEKGIWRISNQIQGVWRDVADYYIDTPWYEDDAVYLFRIAGEHNYDDPANPFANIRSDVRWHNVRVYDSALGRWVALNKWKITSFFEEAVNPDTSVGWFPQVASDKLTMRVGMGAGEWTTVGRYFLNGFTYRNASGTALDAIGVQTWGSYTGPMWRTGGVPPFVMVDHTRGFWVLGPGASAARQDFVIDQAGNYFVDGNFARANTFTGQGDGVSLAIHVDGTEVWSSTIPPGVGGVDPDPDPNNLFTGWGNRPFSVSCGQLWAGSVISFVVTQGAGSDYTFDETALRVSISWSELSYSVAAGEATRNYLLRYQRRGDGAWQHKLIYDANEAVIAPARIGTYDLELYALSPSGQPSDVLRAVYDFEPDRDYEDLSVLNLRCTNRSELNALEFRGSDVLLAWTEPDLTGEYTGGESADVNSGLDPLLRDFELQVFDPATGTVLRTENGLRAREYRYTRSMNADDQALAFNRAPHRELGFRVRMHSTTNRTSAWQTIAVANPKPDVPTGATLSASPGNGTQSLPASVHVAVSPGTSNADADFRRYAVWASETPGFTPGPSSFKAVGGEKSTNITFPASSGVTIYVRIGGLDDFHGAPDAIADPTAEVNLLGEQSILTVDGAVFPVETEDIVKKAVTDVFSAHQTVRFPLGSGGDVDFRQVLSLNALPSGGIVAVKADVLLSRGQNQIEGTVRVLRDSRFSVVKLWDNDVLQFLDFTADAYDIGAGDVTLFGDTSDVLYIGSTIPFGRAIGIGLMEENTHVGVVITSGAGGNAGMTRQYWNGSWAPLVNVTDQTGGFQSSGFIQWDIPLDWSMTTIDGDTLYWVRFQRTLAPTPGATAARIYLRQVMDAFTILPAGGQEYLLVPLAYTIDPTETLEGVKLEANSTAGGSPNVQDVETSTLQLTVGKR